MKELFNWFITSSQDPLKTSLAVRGFLLLLIPKLAVALPLVCKTVSVCIDPAHLNPLAEVITEVVKWTMYTVGGITGVVGLYRKFQAGKWSAY